MTVRYSFHVRLLHPLSGAGLSRRFRISDLRCLFRGDEAILWPCLARRLTTMRQAAPETMARQAAPETTARQAAAEIIGRQPAPERMARQAAPETMARQAAPETMARQAAPGDNGTPSGPGGAIPGIAPGDRRAEGAREPGDTRPPKSPVPEAGPSGPLRGQNRSTRVTKKPRVILSPPRGSIKPSLRSVLIEPRERNVQGGEHPKPEPDSDPVLDLDPSHAR